jgi:hypothetical protein
MYVLSSLIIILNKVMLGSCLKRQAQRLLTHRCRYNLLDHHQM